MGKSPKGAEPVRVGKANSPQIPEKRVYLMFFYTQGMQREQHEKPLVG
jgi:hypothetical protein